MRTWLVHPDWQVPHQDSKTIRLINTFAADIGVTDVLHVGDEIDQESVSRWVRGRAGEYANTLQKEIDATRALLAETLDTLQPNSFTLMRSNHGDRIRKYIDEKAPALSPLDALDYESLMGFEEMGIDYKRQPFEFAKGWLLAHGDEGSMSRVPGSTAMNLAKRLGGAVSVVCGHTHRLGLQHDNGGWGGRIRTHSYGIEVGHAMDLKKASYLGPAKTANWQSGCAILEESDDGIITPHLIPIIRHTITYGNETYKG